jgi:hypothetical protein
VPSRKHGTLIALRTAASRRQIFGHRLRALNNLLNDLSCIRTYRPSAQLDNISLHECVCVCVYARAYMHDSNSITAITECSATIHSCPRHNAESSMHTVKKRSEDNLNALKNDGSNKYLSVNASSCSRPEGALLSTTTFNTTKRRMCSRPFWSESRYQQGNSKFCQQMDSATKTQAVHGLGLVLETGSSRHPLALRICELIQEPASFTVR